MRRLGLVPTYQSKYHENAFSPQGIFDCMLFIHFYTRHDDRLAFYFCSDNWNIFRRARSKAFYQFGRPGLDIIGHPVLYEENQIEYCPGVHRISHAPVAFDTALGYFPETNVRISFIYFSICLLCYTLSPIGFIFLARI